MVWVKVDAKALDNLERAMSIDMASEDFASALMDAAAYHANEVLTDIPEAAKGKIQIEISDPEEDGSGGSVVITYRAKAGAEASTFQQGPLFIPLSKLGMGSTKRTVTSRGGEEGIYVTKVTTTGRPSIEAYAMKSIQDILPDVSARTLQFASAGIREALREYFITHGVKYTSAGRWQAGPGGFTWPSGEHVPGGRFITGAF